MSIYIFSDQAGTYTGSIVETETINVFKHEACTSENEKIGVIQTFAYDAVFLPSCYGLGIITGNDEELKLWKLKDDAFYSTTFDGFKGMTGTIVITLLGSQLLVSCFKEDNIYLYKVNIDSISLELIQIYSPPAGSTFYSLFFNCNSEICTNTESEFIKFNINSNSIIKSTKIEPFGNRNYEFACASMSPVDPDCIAVVSTKGRVDIYEDCEHSSFESEVEDPTTVLWSPLGTSLSICTDSFSTVFEQVSPSVWKRIETDEEYEDY